MASQGAGERNIPEISEQARILLMQEIMHHLGYIKLCKCCDIYRISWCRISSIHCISRCLNKTIVSPWALSKFMDENPWSCSWNIVAWSDSHDWLSSISICSFRGQLEVLNSETHNQKTNICNTCKYTNTRWMTTDTTAFKCCCYSRFSLRWFWSLLGKVQHCNGATIDKNKHIIYQLLKHIFV